MVIAVGNDQALF